MGKKALRREIAALRHEVAALTKREIALIAERDLLGDALLDAGLLRIGTPRTSGDRLRSAQAGVVVLDDFHLATEPQYRVERNFVSSMFHGDVPGPLHSSLALELTGDPTVLETVAEYLRTHRR